MRMRLVGTILAALVIIGGIGALGYGIFQTGYQQGLVESVELAADGAEIVTPVAVGFYPGYHGFGIFGLFFKVLFLFLIFGFIFKLIFGRRRWGPRPNGPGWSDGDDPGSHPMAKRFAAWHQQMHEGDDAGKPDAGTQP